MSNPKSELKVVIQDDKLYIEIGIDTLSWAALTGPYFDKIWYDSNGKGPKITDPIKFAEAILSELKDEQEDGTTVVHEMLDKAAQKAVENGAEGIILPDEKGYEDAQSKI